MAAAVRGGAMVRRRVMREAGVPDPVEADPSSQEQAEPEQPSKPVRPPVGRYDARVYPGGVGAPEWGE